MEGLGDRTRARGSQRGEAATTFGFIDPDTGTQKPVPYTCAFIKLDGADTSIAHFLSETDIDKIRVGMRVQAVFEEERKGSLLDVKHFAPIGE